MKESSTHTLTANYHTHTVRCNHAVGSEREYIENAVSRGLKLLGFSDHSPQLFPTDDYYSSFRMRPQETEGYFHTLSELRREYKDDIEIRIGFEAEYYPEIFDKLIEFIEPFGFDYLILGQHFLDNEYDTKLGCSQASDSEERLKRYVDQVLEAVSTQKFSYIAHPDMYNFIGDDAVFKRHFRRLCDGAKAASIPLEINLHGLASGRYYPSERFFRIAAEVGNDFVFGCDAHEPDEIMNPVLYKKALDLASSLRIVPLERVKLKKI